MYMCISILWRPSCQIYTAQNTKLSTTLMPWFGRGIVKERDRRGERERERADKMDEYVESRIKSRASLRCESGVFGQLLRSSLSVWKRRRILSSHCHEFVASRSLACRAVLAR